MKPLAKKYQYLADSGEFEGFVDLYPGQSMQTLNKLNAAVIFRCSMIIPCQEKKLDEKY